MPFSVATQSITCSAGNWCQAVRPRRLALNDIKWIREAPAGPLPDPTPPSSPRRSTKLSADRRSPLGDPSRSRTSRPHLAWVKLSDVFTTACSGRLRPCASQASTRRPSAHLNLRHGIRGLWRHRLGCQPHNLAASNLAGRRKLTRPAGALGQRLRAAVDTPIRTHAALPTCDPGPLHRRPAGL